MLLNRASVLATFALFSVPAIVTVGAAETAKAMLKDAKGQDVGSVSFVQTPAERRQVTVMLSDLVGSTAPRCVWSPEDPREVISAYQKCVVETVQRFGVYPPSTDMSSR